MARPTKQRRKTQKRKTAQAEARRVAKLRQQAVMFEGVTAKGAARMSPERLEETVRRGRRRKGMTGAPLGLGIALVAAELALTTRR